MGMYDESCLKSELAPGKNSRRMHVDALDVVTSYKDNQQHLKLAVSVTDLAGYPVFESGVESRVNAMYPFVISSELFHGTSDEFFFREFRFFFSHHCLLLVRACRDYCTRTCRVKESEI